MTNKYSCYDDVLKILKEYYKNVKIGTISFFTRADGENTMSVIIEGELQYMSFLPAPIRRKIYKLIN